MVCCVHRRHGANTRVSNYISWKAFLAVLRRQLAQPKATSRHFGSSPDFFVFLVFWCCSILQAIGPRGVPRIEGIGAGYPSVRPAIGSPVPLFRRLCVLVDRQGSGRGGRATGRAASRGKNGKRRPPCHVRTKLGQQRGWGGGL